MQPIIRQVSSFFYNRNFGLLLIRIAAGGIFLAHGLSKISDLSATILMFDALGLSPLFAITAAWLEILGGASLVLGIAPRIFAGLLGIEMLIAAALVGRTQGGQGVELELLLAAVSLGIMLLGSGRFALYKMECDTCNGLLCIKKNRVCVMAA